MRDRLAFGFGLTALVAIVVTWFAAHVSYPMPLRLLTVLLGVGLAALVGARVGSRLSRSFHALVRRDQAVAVRASHELRTPITALRLSLEDLTLWKQTPPEVSAELQRSIEELDRLGDAITGLLDEHRADQRRTATPLDVATLTAEAVERRRAALGGSRPINLGAHVPSPVHLDAVPVVQILDALLAQFDASGGGEIDIEVEDLRRTILVRMSDAGARTMTPGVVHGPTTHKGIGAELSLAEAGGLAESLGGYVAVEDVPNTSLALILPAARRART